jgi:CxxC motif-containing protein
MKELTCIVCPIGCSLLIEEASGGGDRIPALNVTGNRCPRGAVYAREEILAPKRVVTATCRIMASSLEEVCPSLSLTAPRRIPVKTSIPCPKEKITELLADIYRLKLSLPVKAGEIVISNWKELGINVVAVRSLE